jgi:hypothetical protein
VRCVFFETGCSQFVCQNQSFPKTFKCATSKGITEGYRFQFGGRLSSFMNPCSLSDGHLPKLQEMTFPKISSAVVIEQQKLWPKQLWLE